MKNISISILLMMAVLNCVAQEKSKNDTLDLSVSVEICLDCPRERFVTGDILINPYDFNRSSILLDSIPKQKQQMDTLGSGSALAARVNSLQGLWSAHWTEHIPANPLEDAYYHYIYHSTDIYIEGDSIWRLDYPCKRTAVSIVSPNAFKFINDSTVHYGIYRYSRSNNYDTATISNLKAYELNPECYLGEWYLNNIESEGDGTGYVLIYPFSLDSLLFLDEIIEKKIIIAVEGGQREFNFELSTQSFSSELILTPTDSWLDKDKVMWRRDWDLPPPTDYELNEIRQGKGELPSELKLVFKRL